MRDITLYMWATPNSRRVSVLFEELGLGYRVKGVNIRAKEQFAPDFLALNPYGKVPVVVWREDDRRRILFESGAILTAFAETCGRLLPAGGAERAEVLTWLMVALTSLAPLTGQAHHWSRLAPEKPPAALRHYVALVERVYRLLDKRLEGQPYLAGEYSIADIAAYPWIGVSDWTTLALADFPHLAAWHAGLGARPAVARGMAKPEGVRLE